MVFRIFRVVRVFRVWGPLIQEYSFKYRRVPLLVQGIFLN